MAEDSGSDSKQTFCLATDEERRQFLTDNYDFLGKRIRANRFYPHLITKGVLDKRDEQEIERTKTADESRAYALLDLIMTRGEIAFTAFMTVLEYDYHSVYEKITTRVSRRPPSDWRPRVTSLHHFEMLSELLENFESTLVRDMKRKMHMKMQDFSNELCVSKIEVTQEMKAIEDELSESQRKLENVTADRENVREQLKQCQHKVTSQDNEMVVVRRELQNCRSELKTVTGKIDLQRSRSEHSTSVTTKAAAKFHDVVNLTQKAIFERERQRHADETDDLRYEIKVLENRLTTHEEDITSLNEQIDTLIEKRQMDQKQYDALKSDYDSEQRRTEAAFQRQDDVVRHLRNNVDLLRCKKEAADKKHARIESLLMETMRECDKLQEQYDDVVKQVHHKLPGHHHPPQSSDPSPPPKVTPPPKHTQRSMTLDDRTTTTKAPPLSATSRSLSANDSGGGGGAVALSLFNVSHICMSPVVKPVDTEATE